MYTGARVSPDGVAATTMGSRKKDLISLLMFFRIQIGNAGSVFGSVFVENPIYFLVNKYQF